MPDTPEAFPPKTLLAFDFGLRRIGVAAGQSVTGTAGPLGTIGNGENGPEFSRIDALVAEWQPDVLVVGLPRSADDEESRMAAAARRFAKSLAHYELPVHLVDERLTSVEAGAALKRARQSGQRGRIRKEHIDAAAAVLIAERFLGMQPPA